MRDGWRSIVLGEVVRNHRNSVHPKGMAARERIYSIPDLDAGIAPQEVASDTIGSSKFRVGEEALLVSMLNPRIPRQIIAEAGSICSTEFAVLTPDTESLCLRYLALLTSSTKFQTYLSSTAKGTTGSRSRSKASDVLGFTALIPPLEEQRRIVDLIGAVDDAIEAAEGVHHQLGTALVQLRQRAFGNLTDSLFASEVFDILIGLQRSPQRADGPNQTPYLRSYNVGKGHLILDDVKTMAFTPEQQAKYRLRDGDVLVSEGSASAEAVGAPSEYHDEVEGTVGFQNTLLRFRAVPGVSTPQFVSHWCSWAYESGAFREAASGTNIKHIGSRGAALMRVAAVEYDQQESLAEHLDAAQTAASLAQQQTTSLRDLRSNLLTALLSGQHEIPESYDELITEEAA